MEAWTTNPLYSSSTLIPHLYFLQSLNSLNVPAIPWPTILHKHPPRYVLSKSSLVLDSGRSFERLILCIQQELGILIHKHTCFPPFPNAKMPPFTPTPTPSLKKKRHVARPPFSDLRLFSFHALNMSALHYVWTVFSMTDGEIKRKTR